MPQAPGESPATALYSYDQAATPQDLDKPDAPDDEPQEGGGYEEGGGGEGGGGRVREEDGIDDVQRSGGSALSLDN